MAAFVIGGLAAWFMGRKHWPREKDFTNGIGMEMVWCAPGTFLMGSPDSEPGRHDNEIRHEVTLTNGFWIGRYEVTQEQFARVAGLNPSHDKKDKHLWVLSLPRPRAPVERIHWEDARKFCEELTRRELTAGRLKGDWVYSLPTEAQWEYAARAGTTTAFAFGDTLHKNQANFGTGRRTAPCGSRKPNAWGIYDMHGNVWEWCADWYTPYLADTEIDPAGPANASLRLIRGAAHNFAASMCRSAKRDGQPPASSSNDIGFRLCLIPSKQANNP